MTNSDLTSPPKEGTRALIIGSGIAGLCAARVLSDYYDQVHIVERDTWPEKPTPRAGIPQSFHLHRLGLSGKEAMQNLFPGLIDELLERGAVTTRSKKWRVVSRFGQSEIGAPAEYAFCSRSLLEFTIRQRVQALPNTIFSPALAVIGLQMDPDHTRITGVQVRSHDQTKQLPTLTADLIIDASGRSSKTTQWLQRLNYEVPEPERLKTAIGYSTRYYRVSPRINQEMASTLIFDHPEKQIRAAFGLQVENNQWHVTLYGAGGHYPATDDNGFEQQIRQAISPVLADMLQTEAEPTLSPRGYRLPECQRYHFEQMENWPTGLLVIGDAFCNVDPIYGHGMTIAALEAEMLANNLREHQTNPQPDFERRTLKLFHDAVEPAWWLCAIADLRWPGVTYTGQQPPKAVALLQRYLDLYLQEATKRTQEAIKPMEKHASHASDRPVPAPNLSSPEPSLSAYLLMLFNLFLPPQVVFNAITYHLLLEAEAAQEGPQLLQQLTDAYNLPLEEILKEILPTFSPSLRKAPA